VDGSQTFLNRYHAETLNQLDPETFLRHSEISDTYHIRLDFLRDFKNCLRLLSKEDHCDFIEELEKDSSRMVIAKLANRVFHQESWTSKKDDKKDKTVDLLAERVTSQTSQIYKELGDGAAPTMKIEKSLDHFAF
jgi:hypothetical protein